ncbi:hypothetical protein H0H92_006217 [Tricholoma furcatifolium]|nr:hypothetical protein H0H92_006217 [Tricholoma furcatifolium]
MSHIPPPGLPPASGTLPTDQDDPYTWLHALEQGLTTSNLSQQALSQQISVVQAQLKELLAAVHPTPQAASHSPTTIHPFAAPAPTPKLAVHCLPAPALLQALAPPVRVPAAPIAAPKLSMGVPMDIDTAHHKGPLPTSICCHCSKPGLSGGEDAAAVSSLQILMESPEEVAEPAEEDFCQSVPPQSYPPLTLRCRPALLVSASPSGNTVSLVITPSPLPPPPTPSP